MANSLLDSKRALPNKMLNEDGTVTDLKGKSVLVGTNLWESMRSIPNKFLNPDGTYSTLNEIIVGNSIDTELFVVVSELPETGEKNKIYLVTKPSPETGFFEYSYTEGQWNIIGDVDVDLSSYSTTKEVQAAIATALENAKAYTDDKIKNFVPLQSFPDSFNTTGTTEEFFDSIKASNPTVGSYYLGQVKLTDMPEGLTQAEVLVLVYPNKALYATMRDANLAPYVWECNSLNYSGWGNQDSSTLQDAKTYTDNEIKKSITTTLGGDF